NINVVLTALAVIIALLVSNYITLPMKLIQEKLSRLKLGKKNEKISWKKNDEIGGLIDDYNRVIDELAVSAEMLAKSERESAWREMAKQIAHEIKNPLTPMKLSVQHLKKAWDEKTPDWEKRFEKFSKTMIEQIESLSNIASEFSDFSKLPKTIDEPIDLIQIIENAVELYRENKQNIYFNKPELGKWEVLADKTQLIRIFNNLIKNSVQAISSLENGMIEIGIKKEESQYVIEIKDNGVGIANEQKEKIFSPNFTTKTGGMGLGLAMVRNIVENYKGKIWFESETGIGTTFFVKLPAID
ncbi:MAG TPA: ATP-binding protein, partial [Bacteroidales bacterium]|nr:ATP-binding protein [Bacteroidales bacterium]